VFAALAVVARWYNGEWRTTGHWMITVPVIFSLLLGLLLYYDPYFTYMLAIPIILLFGSKWLLHGKDRRA
jgi:hypothetical protein